MLVSPIAVPISASAAPAKRANRRVPRAPASRRLHAPVRPGVAPLLVLWLAFGLAVVLLVPAARGGERLGATLPFWLVVAPAIDMLWSTRRHWSVRLRGILRRRRGALPAQAHRSDARSRRCRAERSSRK